ncbi:hypothetical protein FBU30_009274 [Linnemannia zychae]|nr:hypothetical protein FBU30_009274 [Linnemannia zychae]
MSTGDKPTILIVGAGLGGLMLGALLEKSGHPYTIFERAAVVKPLDLYSIMLKLVPSHKIHFGKRVSNIVEANNKVTIQTSDNETFEGDILVGADGTYSTVRQSMYEQLKSIGQLPKVDQEDLPYNYASLVGQTKVLDPKEFPSILEPTCRFNVVFGDSKPYTWCTFTTAPNTICWMIFHNLPKQSSKVTKEKQLLSHEDADWGPTAALSMCEATRDFPLPSEHEGKKLTLGDLYNVTPKEQISKVMLEEKIFETWHHGRIVLMGDGAVTAMHDAIALANLFYAMPTKTSEDIATIFKEYQTERFPAVLEALEISQFASKTIDRGIIGTIVLYFAVYMPAWLWRRMMVKRVRHRPQVGYLEAIPPRGTIEPVPSPSELKARAVFERQQ